MIYLGYYDTKENKAENRGYVLAATNKMDYIIKSLTHIGEKVNIISASVTKNYGKFYSGKKINLDENITLRLFSTMQSSFRPYRVILRQIFAIKMFFYLFFTIKRNETIIVYHSLGYMNMVYLIKRLKKVKLILEVEEIYGDVICKNKTAKKELLFFEIADSYIFSTKYLNDLINTTNKPHTVIYGTYQVEPSRNSQFTDGKIHAVYAGTFDPRKGVPLAVIATENLSELYHIHILGFGTRKDTIEIQELIAQTAKKTKCTITYHGLLYGEEYTQLIQGCTIGLSPQYPDAEFSNTSFPSKVLSYLSNGLKVVTINIPTIVNSSLKDELFFYTEATPKAVAQAIIEAAKSPKNADSSRKLLNELDYKFKKDLQLLLK